MSNDRELLESFRAGDQAAFARLVELHGDAVYRVCLRLTGNGALAEEAVQETFVRLLRQPPGLDGRPLLPWLLQTAANTAIDLARSEQRRRRREEQAVASREASDMKTETEPELRGALRLAVAALPETERTAVVLHYYESLSLDEVGQVLGCSAEGARSRVRRATEELREALSRAGFAATVPAMLAACRADLLPAAPAALKAKLGTLAIQGIKAGGLALPAAKGGIAMKVILGVVGAGVLAGAVTLALPGKTSPPPLAAPPAGQPAKAAESRIIPLAFVTGWLLLTQDGPALSAAASPHSPSIMDNVGNIYLLDAAQQQIFVYIREENRVYTLCNGSMGYRDGPAGEAQIGSIFTDQEVPALAVDAKNRLIFSDSRSGTLRMVERREDGRFWFSTLLGGGKRAPGSLKAGESVPAAEVGKVGRCVMALARDGTDAIYLNMAWIGNFKLADGKFTRLQMDKMVCALSMDVDADGNLYMVNDERRVYVKVGKDGKVVFLGGLRCYKDLVPPDAPPLLPGGTGRDGPMIQATFWCPARCSLSADGKTLYIGGGDESSIRRLTPISPQGRVSTLMTDGTWKECESFPEKGQWKGSPDIHGKTGLCVGCAGTYMWEHPYQQAFINLIEGPQVELVRKAFGLQTGGGK